MYHTLCLHSQVYIDMWNNQQLLDLDYMFHHFHRWQKDIHWLKKRRAHMLWWGCFLEKILLFVSIHWSARLCRRDRYREASILADNNMTEMNEIHNERKAIILLLSFSCQTQTCSCSTNLFLVFTYGYILILDLLPVYL